MTTLRFIEKEDHTLIQHVGTGGYDCDWYIGIISTHNGTGIRCGIAHHPEHGGPVVWTTEDRGSEHWGDTGFDMHARARELLAPTGLSTT